MIGFTSTAGWPTTSGCPRATLLPLPDGLAAEDACLVETASVSWHGVRMADPEPGERVVVVGGGAIGLMAVAAARARGAEVALEARHPHQRAAGERLGATTPSGEYDVVIEAAGTESGLARCAELARPGGRVVLLGVYFSHVPVPGVPTLVKELSWKGAMAYGVHDGVRDFAEAAELIAATPDLADTLITHRFPLDDAAEAFRVAGRPGRRRDQGGAATVTTEDRYAAPVNLARGRIVRERRRADPGRQHALGLHRPPPAATSSRTTAGTSATTTTPVA